MRIALLLLLATALMAGASPVPVHLMRPVEQTESDRLQGKWKVESVHIGATGMPVGTQGLAITLEFRGNKMIASAPAQTTTAEIKLDTADGGLKRCAMNKVSAMDRDGKKPRTEPDMAFGYILSGDRLTLASTEKESKAADPAKPGDNTVVVVLVRVKEKK